MSIAGKWKAYMHHLRMEQKERDEARNQDDSEVADDIWHSEILSQQMVLDYPEKALLTSPKLMMEYITQLETQASKYENEVRDDHKAVMERVVEDMHKHAEWYPCFDQLRHYYGRFGIFEGGVISPNFPINMWAEEDKFFLPFDVMAKIIKEPDYPPLADDNFSPHELSQGQATDAIIYLLDRVHYLEDQFNELMATKQS